MAQVTSGEIACSGEIGSDTSVIFRIGPVRITGFACHFVYKGTAKRNFESRKK